LSDIICADCGKSIRDYGGEYVTDYKTICEDCGDDITDLEVLSPLPKERKKRKPKKQEKKQSVG
jgi:hypothetical protein